MEVNKRLGESHAESKAVSMGAGVSLAHAPGDPPERPVDQMGPDEEQQIRQMYKDEFSTADLVALCRKLGLPAAGSSSVLIDRLLEAEKAR